MESRYLPVLGFNTKQWWIYDEEKSVYIDPPLYVTEQAGRMDEEEAMEYLYKEIEKSPDWMGDKEYWYNGDDFEI